LPIDAYQIALINFFPTTGSEEEGSHNMTLSFVPTVLVHRRAAPFLLFLSFFFSRAVGDFSTYNGGSVLAMAGKDCVALAVDKRFGSGPQMIGDSSNSRRIHVVSPSILAGFVGLDCDVQSLIDEVSTECAKYTLNSCTSIPFRDAAVDSKHGKALSSKVSMIRPSTAAALFSNVMYTKRSSPFLYEAILISLDEDTNIPRLCAMDPLGARLQCQDFACAGAATKSLYGCAEANWREGMDEAELERALGESFMSALERDCLSGYGTIVSSRS
jgi:20S proteasome subunit beta 3